MKSRQIAQLLQKTAAVIDSLQEENARLQGQLKQHKIVAASGEVLDKVAEVTGVDKFEAYEAIKSMNPVQRAILEKTASSRDEDLLGGLSEYSSTNNGESAEADLINFCTS